MNLSPSSANANSLKIYAINVNSIQHNRRRLELQKLLVAKNPDIALISETKLNQNHIIIYKNHNIVRTDRPRSIQGGRTAVQAS